MNGAVQKMPVSKFGAKKAPGKGVFFVCAVGKGRYCKKAGSTVYPMKEVVT